MAHMQIGASTCLLCPESFMQFCTKQGAHASLYLMFMCRMPSCQATIILQALSKQGHFVSHGMHAHLQGVRHPKHAHSANQGAVLTLTMLSACSSHTTHCSLHTHVNCIPLQWRSQPMPCPLGNSMIKHHSVIHTSIIVSGQRQAAQGIRLFRCGGWCCCQSRGADCS